MERDGSTCSIQPPGRRCLVCLKTGTYRDGGKRVLVGFLVHPVPLAVCEGAEHPSQVDKVKFLWVAVLVCLKHFISHEVEH